MKTLKSVIVLGTTACAVLLAVTTVVANHAWGTYHWARDTNPVTLDTGDNVDTRWDVYLDEAIHDWNNPTNGRQRVIELVKVDGRTNPKNCRPTAGRIEVCNANYGRNGWLGLAQIWVSGSHITQAVSKLNDTYFESATYNTPAWRRMVMCQEIAHDFGLDHQDETFNNANVGSCMDYTNDPDGGVGGASPNDPSNEHPNDHDFEQLERIYSHTDNPTTANQRNNAGGVPAQFERGQFGQLVRTTNGGRTELYVLELGAGRRVFTHVIWAE